jgi:hypothetical protein
MTHFFNTNYSPKCLDRIKEELASPNWYLSPYNTERSDLSKELKAHLQSLLPFKISDAGFLRRRPNSIYHPHIDPKREFALNLSLTEDSENSGTYVIKMHTKTDNGVIGFHNVYKEQVSYTKDCFTVLNVKQIHYVVNHSDHDRIILSIGCNETTYRDIIKTIMTDISKI